jgi:hypothetical protein
MAAEKHRAPNQGPGFDPGLGAPSGPAEWTRHVRLERLTGHRIVKGPLRGHYQYIVEFSTTREIPIELPQPKGTVVLFGRTRQLLFDRTPKKDKRPQAEPDRCRLVFIREPKRGQLMGVEISGALRFRLSRGMVRPVVERNGAWVDAETTHVIVPLGNAKISLRRGLPPKLSRPLNVPPLTVRLGPTQMVAKLIATRIDLAGTSAKPRLRFKGVRLTFLAH